MMDVIRTISWLTLRQLFARRRVWVVVAVAVLPFLLTFIYRLTSEDREGDRLVFMLGMYREIVIGVLLPLTAVLFGALAFGAEVEEGTLVYLLVRPVPRWLVVTVKFLVAALVTTATIGFGMLLAWISLRGPELPGTFFRAFLLAAAAGALLYTAIFAYVGLVTKRGLVMGLLYVILFENLVTRMLEGIRIFSVREFALSIAQWAGDGVVKWPGYTVPMTTVWIVGAIALVGAMVAMTRKYARYELAERL